MATVSFVFVATFFAIFNTNAVLPTDGRAAKIINSSEWSPEVIRSKSMYPVGIPVISPVFFIRSSRDKYASFKTFVISTNPARFLFSETSKILRSALSNTAATSSVSPYASVAISVEVRINFRKVDFSLTILE